MATLSDCKSLGNGGSGIRVLWGAHATLNNNTTQGNKSTGIQIAKWKTRVDGAGNNSSDNGDYAIAVRDGAAAMLSDSVVAGPEGKNILVSDEGSTLEETGTTTASGEAVSRKEGRATNRQIQVDDSEIKYLLEAKDFDALEELGGRIRELKSRSETGAWMTARFYDGFDDGFWKIKRNDRTAYLGVLEEWKQARPESVMPYIVEAETHIDYAWTARGGGYANEVTEAGRKGFICELELAEEALKAGEALEQKDPQLYADWLTVGMGNDYSRAEMDALVEKSRAIDPGYYPVYHTMTYNLTPRWNGSIDDMKEFADQANGWAGAEQGDQMYALLATYLCSYVEYEDLENGSYLAWERVDKGLSEARAAFPNSKEYLNQHCRMACFYRNLPRAVELFNLIGEEYTGDAWSDEDEFRGWRRWALDNAPPPIDESYEEPEPSTMPNDEFEAYLKFVIPIFLGAVLVFTVLITLLIVVLLRRSEKK
jgi:hypothetical protein